MAYIYTYGVPSDFQIFFLKNIYQISKHSCPVIMLLLPTKRKFADAPLDLFRIFRCKRRIVYLGFSRPSPGYGPLFDVESMKRHQMMLETERELERLRRFEGSLRESTAMEDVEHEMADAGPPVQGGHQLSVEQVEEMDTSECQPQNEVEIEMEIEGISQQQQRHQEDEEMSTIVPIFDIPAPKIPGPVTPFFPPILPPPSPPPPQSQGPVTPSSTINPVKKAAGAPPNQPQPMVKDLKSDKPNVAVPAAKTPIISRAPPKLRVSMRPSPLRNEYKPTGESFSDDSSSKTADLPKASTAASDMPIIGQPAQPKKKLGEPFLRVDGQRFKLFRGRVGHVVDEHGYDTGQSAWITVRHRIVKLNFHDYCCGEKKSLGKTSIDDLAHLFENSSIG